MPDHRASAAVEALVAAGQSVGAQGSTQGEAGAPARSRDTRRRGALAALLRLAPHLVGSELRWALSGHVALRAHGAEVAAGPGVDIIAHDRDRQILQLLRDADLRVAHHSAALFTCHAGPVVADDSIRVHFPTTPPLSLALERGLTSVCIEGVALPAVDLHTLVVANLVSQRADAEAMVRAATSTGRVDLAVIGRELSLLDAYPATRSPHVLRIFDRPLGQRRLQMLKAQ